MRDDTPPVRGFFAPFGAVVSRRGRAFARGPAGGAGALAARRGATPQESVIGACNGVQRGAMRPRTVSGIALFDEAHAHQGDPLALGLRVVGKVVGHPKPAGMLARQLVHATATKHGSAQPRVAE